MISQFTFKLDEIHLSQQDRNGVVIFFSALIHVVLIMGLGFSYTINDKQPHSNRSIDTVLVNAKTNETVDDSELFAQASQQGGGIIESDQPTRSPLPLLNNSETRLTQNSGGQTDPTKHLQKEFIVVLTDDSIFLNSGKEEFFKTPDEKNDDNQLEQSEASISSKIAAEFDTKLNLGSTDIRQKFISSRTREHKYASYMESWRAKVELVGNTNYPEIAREQKLSGNLVINVSIQSDGSILSLDVIRSSGQKILDDAALRIVMMAAPFDSFPEDIQAEADVIHITRTWQFLHNSTLIGNE